MAGDLNRPNGLCFSPDESKLYVGENGVTPRKIHVYDVVGGGTKLGNKKQFLDCGPGTVDGFRCDTDGNLWCGWGMGSDELDGVMVFNPPARPSAASSCPNAARTCASAAPPATACSWRPASRSMRCTWGRRGRRGAGHRCFFMAPFKFGRLSR